MQPFSDLTAKLPSSLNAKLAPVGEKLDLAFFGTGPRSIAARTALISFSMRIFNAGLAYISQIILARVMGQYEYGVYAIVWVWLIALSTLCALGYPTGLLRFVPELYKTGRHRELKMVMVRGSLVGVSFATLLALTGVSIVLLAPDIVEQPFVLPIILAAVCLPMLTLLDNQDAVAQSFSWPLLLSLPSFVIRPLIILLGLIVLVLAGAPSTAGTAMIATIIAIWSVVIGQLLILRHRVTKMIGKNPVDKEDALPEGKTTGTIQPYVRAALPMLAVEGMFYLILNIDIIVAGLFVSPDQVAIYYAAAKTLALVHFVYFAIRVATAHRIAEYHALDNQKALRSTLRDAIRWTFWPSLAIALCLWAGGGLILGLFGEVFAEQGMVYLSVLLIGVVIRSSIGPAEAMLTMANAQKLAAWLYATVFLVNLSLNFLLIPTIGLVGAAIATATSMCIEAILLVLAVRHTLGITSFIGAVGRLRPSKDKEQAGQEAPSPAPGPAE